MHNNGNATFISLIFFLKNIIKIAHIPVIVIIVYLAIGTKNVLKLFFNTSTLVTGYCSFPLTLNSKVSNAIAIAFLCNIIDAKTHLVKNSKQYPTPHNAPNSIALIIKFNNLVSFLFSNNSVIANGIPSVTNGYVNKSK